MQGSTSGIEINKEKLAVILENYDKVHEYMLDLEKLVWTEATNVWGRKPSYKKFYCKTFGEAFIKSSYRCVIFYAKWKGLVVLTEHQQAVLEHKLSIPEYYMKDLKSLYNLGDKIYISHWYIKQLENYYNFDVGSLVLEKVIAGDS